MYWGGLLVRAGVSADVERSPAGKASCADASASDDFLGVRPWGKRDVIGFLEQVGDTAAFAARLAEWRGVLVRGVQS